MGASGHIAGVINPPAKNKRSHWLREDGEFPPHSTIGWPRPPEYPGSWWTDWSAWLEPCRQAARGAQELWPCTRL
jgi:polyhydroxyalkanoate synthase